MANSTYGQSGRALTDGAFGPRMRRIPRLAGIFLTLAMLAALVVAGTMAEQNRTYDAVLIEAPLAAKVRPREPGGQLTEFQEFTLNEIIAGNDASAKATVTGYAPPSAELGESDLSPRARREWFRLLNQPEFRSRSSLTPEPARISEAKAIWRSFAPTRGTEARKIEPSAVAEGTDIAQLGDFRNRESALVSWSLLKGRYPELVAGIDWYVEDARNGGRPITRLRVTGFGAREIALWFCEELKAKDQTCIPTVNR